MTEPAVWNALWDERNREVIRVLGEPSQDDESVPFSWGKYELPGACAMTFEPSPLRRSYLYMTLGLSQPLEEADPPFHWEFAIRTKDRAPWAIDLLYGIVTHWLTAGRDLTFGHTLPMTFFHDENHDIAAGLTTDLEDREALGAIRSLILWRDHEEQRFDVSKGEFQLLEVIPVSEEEAKLVEQTSPAHVVLLLRRMNLAQICDPERPSVMTVNGAQEAWDKISAMPHSDALATLHFDAGAPTSS